MSGSISVRCTTVDGAVDARIDEEDYDGPYPRNISITKSHFYNFNQGFEAKDDLCELYDKVHVKSVNGTPCVNNVCDWRSKVSSTLRVTQKSWSTIISEPDDRLDAGHI